MATEKMTELLLIEDDPSDIRIIKECLSSDPSIRMTVLRNGEDAIRFLLREEPFANCPKPHLIVMDLNLPRKDGIEVLTEKKKKQELDTIPTIILTTSSSEKDETLARSLNASAYYSKPHDLDQFFDLIRSIIQRWGRQSTNG